VLKSNHRRCPNKSLGPKSLDRGAAQGFALLRDTAQLNARQPKIRRHTKRGQSSWTKHGPDVLVHSAVQTHGRLAKYSQQSLASEQCERR
jgi:hypothetical protein